MAVDMLAKTAAIALERNETFSMNRCTTMPLIRTDVAEESKQTTTKTVAAIRRAKLRRERNELVKYLYNIIDTTRQTSSSDPTSDSESVEESIREMSESDELLERYDHDLRNHRRKTTISRCTRRERTPASKEKKFVDFCRESETPENITLERGRKKAIRVKFYACAKQMSRDGNCREQNLERKANIEKRLRKRGLKRLQETQQWQNYTGNTRDNHDHPATEKFALREGNVPTEMNDMVNFLLSLQFREVTPEDYEHLLRLDESVPTKTVSKSRLVSLREDRTSEEHVHESCGVCMENYEVGQTRKILPCEHAFHSNCIDMWLGQSSNKCPLDGREI
jgi:hypothetical protein